MRAGVCRVILIAYKLLGFKLFQKNSLKACSSGITVYSNCNLLQGHYGKKTVKGQNLNK